MQGEHRANLKYDANDGVKRRNQFVGNRRRAGARADKAGTAEHYRKHFGGFRVRKFTRNFDEMPMTATGKLRKVELRQALPNTWRKRAAGQGKYVRKWPL